MGTYTTQEFIELFGGLPEHDDPAWAGPDPDRIRDAQKDERALRDIRDEGKDSSDGT